ncbi:MAG: tyrosine-type recombinase/integrase [Vulcanimicrobiaceae bacterium]
MIEALRVGQYVSPELAVKRRFVHGSDFDKPVRASTKHGFVAALRRFFQDCHENEWIASRFDPVRSLRLSRNAKSQLVVNPRVIADDVWAKLLAAGLRLTVEDIPGSAFGQSLVRYPTYPLEMNRAVVLVWLFAGLRSDEIHRLRVGCISQPPSLGGTAPSEKSCMLRVPVNKTSPEYVKPVDIVVGEGVEAWERARPAQPPALDRKTGERVAFLFSYRGRRMGKSYINRALIPMLCQKAGVPISDAVGTITTHRARSTIATQLFNAKDPMSLFELQEWLGHSSPHSTQYYAKITPTKLRRSFEDADYFRRNLRTIEVLIDHDAIRSGEAANGKPYMGVDLVHGFCFYEWYSTCPHRMACIKCSYYAPKESSRAQLLEASAQNQRVLLELELTDSERDAVEEHRGGVISLLERNFGLHAPDGSLPAETLGIPESRT